MRVKVACINWVWPRGTTTPHFMSYVLRDGEAVATGYHETWDEAMARGNYLARLISKQQAVAS